MILETGKYYHFYNRSNNEERVFKEDRNYLFFIERYLHYMCESVTTLGYCLMPTHFHFVIKIITSDCDALKKNIAALLSGYTKSVNTMYSRHGSLFQPRSKAKEIDDESYLLTLMSYVHQNPVRAKLVQHMVDWKYSSYPALIGLSNDDIPDKNFLKQYFPDNESFRTYSEELVVDIKRKYWV